MIVLGKFGIGHLVDISSSLVDPRVTAEMICQDRSFTSSIKRIICNCCELDDVNSHCNRNAASIFAKHPLGELGGALPCRKLDSNVTIQLSLFSSEKMRALYFG